MRVTAESIWESITVGLQTDRTGAFQHFAKKYAAIERNPAEREKIINAIDVLIRYLMSDPEVAAAMARGDNATVARALMKLEHP